MNGQGSEGASVKMKCLSVRQPWAHPIFFEAKDVENRTWTTKYRGPLLIHASQKIDRDVMQRLTSDPHFKNLEASCPTSAIIGVVELTDVVTDSRSEWAVEGKYHLLLSKPRLFAEPIPRSGWLGLFDVDIPEAVLKKARKPLARRRGYEER